MVQTSADLYAMHIYIYIYMPVSLIQYIHLYYIILHLQLNVNHLCGITELDQLCCTSYPERKKTKDDGWANHPKQSQNGAQTEMFENSPTIVCQVS